MKRVLFLCLNMMLVVTVQAARPILTQAKWDQMQQGKTAYGEVITPETRPMLIDEPQDDNDQTPPPLPPRPMVQVSSEPTLAERLQDQSKKLKPVPVGNTSVAVTPPPLPPRPTIQSQSGVTTKPIVPFTGQDLEQQKAALKKVEGAEKIKPKPLWFQEQLQDKFKGASGDEADELDEWEEE